MLFYTRNQVGCRDNMVPKFVDTTMQVGYRDDTVPKTVDTRRHCEQE